MENPTIQNTINYDQFISLTFNRDKNKRHVEEIKDMINRENLLHLHPIIVNEKWEIIYGQHRLQAAKEMHLPIFYVQENISYEHILNSNLVQKKLQLKDVIKFYALKDQIKDYIDFRSYMISLQLNPKALFGLLFGTSSGHMMKFIKSGKFRMPPDENRVLSLITQYDDFKKFASEKKIRPASIFTSHNFTIGFRNLILIPQFNERVFYSKLNNRWFEIKPQLDSQMWTKCLVNIYNWKNQNQIDLELDG